MKRFVQTVFMGLLLVLASTFNAQSKSSTILSVESPLGGPILGIESSQDGSFQVAHHSPEEWREFLRKRRAKRKRLRRLRSQRSVAKRKKRSRRVALAKPAKQSSVKKRSTLYDRQQVTFRSNEKPGTVIVETSTKHLYYVLGDNRAVRYGVAVGKQGFAWSGTSTVKRKVEWPAWYPPKSMIKRKPHLKKWKNGQPGGPDNPLGAAALYLFQGNKDTLYRIHGTNAPSSIGTAASSGCIRMRNEDIQHLYSKVNNGTKVIVR
ncbi:MAG: L,D-transpeptidase [Rhizobiaceae bacterium]